MVEVVIGAGYGDEGKGLLTDFFVRHHSKCMVVRFNGGAQAGHTVVTADLPPDKKRHVFNHFGSGTFSNAVTFLSKFFILNPIVFFREKAVLEGLGVSADILTPYVDPEAVITTPYDMLINQIVELARGDGRHGSVGLGIGETIERNEKSPYPLVLGDLQNQSDVKKYVVDLCERIRTQWVPRRLLKLGVVRDEKTEELFKTLESFNDEIWAQDIELFLNSIKITSRNPLAKFKDEYDLVFEGAQGLMLDQDRGAFPFVTRSNTGLKNVVFLCKEAGIDNIDVTYVTRAYVTRHGRGPLAHELTEKPYKGIEEKTNVLNTFQEHFRYAYLDIDILAKAIQDDLTDLGDLTATTNLAVTCLDQIGDEEAKFYLDGVEQSAKLDLFLSKTWEATKLQRLLTSVGPTSGTIAYIWKRDLAASLLTV